MIAADLIVIIALAAFVLWKYRQILGHKTGHDVETPRERLHQKREQAQSRVIDLHGLHAQSDIIEAEALPVDTAFESVENDALKSTLSDMKALDASFALDTFLSGAKAAFEMLIEAFNAQDRATLKMLLSEELFSEFESEIKHREKQNRYPHTTLVAINACTLRDAVLDKTTARLTLNLLSEQIQVVKDKSGQIIEGDKSRIEQIEDEWVFERNLKSRNPNWTIIDM